jgi:catechol 2,3-dioxygenase-like lactoylglutathione lyase family enzyme
MDSKNADGRPTLTTATVVPEIRGWHHLRLPVSNIAASRDWYMDVFGLEPLLVEEDEHGVTGAALRLPVGIVLGLHVDPHRAEALRGFSVVAFSVPDLSTWIEYLDRRGVQHSEPEDCHLGHAIHLTDPDGLLVELHSREQPSADEA